MSVISTKLLKNRQKRKESKAKWAEVPQMMVKGNLKSQKYSVSNGFKLSSIKPKAKQKE